MTTIISYEYVVAYPWGCFFSLLFTSHRTLPNEVWDRAFKFSTYPTLLNILSTSKHLHAVVSVHLRLEFRPERYLCGFLEDSNIPLFLTLQAHTGLVAAGSCALHFLLRIPSDQQELTFYVNEKFSGAARSFFFDVGYKIIEEQQYYGGRGKLPGMVGANGIPYETTHHINHVVSFAKKERPGYVIRLVVIRLHSSILATILTFKASKLFIYSHRSTKLTCNSAVHVFHNTFQGSCPVS